VTVLQIYVSKQEEGEQQKINYRYAKKVGENRNKKMLLIEWFRNYCPVASLTIDGKVFLCDYGTWALLISYFISEAYSVNLIIIVRIRYSSVV